MMNIALLKEFSTASYYQYIYDLGTDEFKYLSLGLKTILGDKRVNNPTYSNYLEKIYPDDVKHLRRFPELTKYFLSEVIAQSEIPFYITTYQYRISDKLGHYKPMLHKGIPLAVSDKKSLSLYIMGIEYDNSQVETSGSSELSFLDLRGKKSYCNIKHQKDFLDNKGDSVGITDREIEILKQLTMGKSSKEIAAHLNISYDTVRTHRNNILKKSKFTNLNQVIYYCAKAGLI